MTATLDPGTANEYRIQAKAHWCSRWTFLGEITPGAIGDYQRARLRKVTRTTLNKERSALRGFLGWCVEQRVLAAIPEFPELAPQAVGQRAVPARKRRPLTDDDVAALVDELPEFSKPHRFRREQTSFRVRDVVSLLWETGLRYATIQRLSVPEHFVKGAKVLILTDDVDKARFGRELPLTRAAAAILERCCPDEGLIFGAHSLREYLIPASEAVLGRRVATDDFRHSRITQWVGEGGNLLGVQYLAGHKHLSTTARYAHPTMDKARAILGIRGPKRGPRRHTKKRRAA